VRVAEDEDDDGANGSSTEELSQRTATAARVNPRSTSTGKR
jgi:hypothetical protein